MTRIGWYVHHHGLGHRTRFLAVRPHLDADVVVFSTLPAPDPLPPRTTWIALPRDDDGVEDGDVTAGGMLHWAPLGHRGHRARLASIARVAVESDLVGMVVDVSAEVVLFARLLGIPVVTIAQPGERTDEPHRLAYRAAARIVAPWAADAVPSPALAPFADRVVDVGGISRFEDRPRTVQPIPGTVFAFPGTPVDAGGEWSVDAPAWVDDPWPSLCRAEVVVSAAGQNSIADLAAAGARAVVVPQSRPFAEQRATAAALAAHGLVIVAERADAAALAAARDLRPDWSVWGVAGAAERAASAIAESFA